MRVFAFWGRRKAPVQFVLYCTNDGSTYSIRRRPMPHHFALETHDTYLYTWGAHHASYNMPASDSPIMAKNANLPVFRASTISRYLATLTIAHDVLGPQMITMKSPKLMLLGVLSLSISVPSLADCEYDKEWCCDPRTWCEAFHHALYQFAFVLLVVTAASPLYYYSKLVRLARDVMQKGTATQARVITIAARRLTSDDAPFEVFEHACLVEFSPQLAERKTLKWVKIGKLKYLELSSSIEEEMPTITKSDFPLMIRTHELEVYRSTNLNSSSVTVYSLSYYPESAVSTDLSSYGLNDVIKLLYVVCLIPSTGGMGFLLQDFVQEYDGHILDAGLKLLVLVATSALAAIIPILVAHHYHKKRRNFILSDEVKVTRAQERIQNENTPFL